MIIIEKITSENFYKNRENNQRFDKNIMALLSYYFGLAQQNLS
jgi:hypothetical protein